MKKILDGLKKVIILISKIVVVAIVAIMGLCLYYKLMDIIFKNFLSQMSVSILANFVLFAVILYFVIFRMVNAPEKMTKMQNDIAETIETSENVKTESEEKLSNIEESMKNLSDEIDLLLKQSGDNAKLVGEKISADTNDAVAVIQQNTKSVIENNRKILKNDILRRASLASIEVAKAHIIEELEQNSELHEKLIDESVNAIEGTEI